MAVMGQRKRTLARAAKRAAEKLARSDEKIAGDLLVLADLAPGGSPERAIVVTSPAEVEVQARGTPCPVCQGELRVDDHAAETVSGVRVRVARVTCVRCGRKRAIHFRLAATMAN
jgi:hypothetical protein